MDASGTLASQNTSYRMTLFGPFAVLTSDGRDATPARRKAKALLAILALAPNGRRTRRWIQDRLWSAATGSRGSASLRQELSALKKHFSAFEGLPLYATGDDVKLDFERVWIDVRDGSPDPHRELLEGMDIGDPEFEDWLSEERAFWYRRLDQGTHPVAGQPARPGNPVELRRLIPRLALRGFSPVGNSEALRFFATGLTEELDSLLGALVGTYRIIVPAFSDAGEADYAMEGSVRGEQIFRVHARIVDLGDGTQVWNGRFDIDRASEMPDTEATARRIIEGLQVALSDGNWAYYWADSDTTTEAWELFQRGRVREAAGSRAALQEAVSFYRAAIGADPGFLQARISLGFCLVDGLRICLHDDPNSAAKEAVEIAESVATKAPNNVYGKALSAFVLCAKGGFGAALATMQGVVEKAPRSAELISYLAAIHGYRGEYDREQVLYRHALRLSPYPPVWIRRNLALSLLLSNSEGAEELLRDVLAEEPDNPRALIAEIVRLVRAGDLEAARATASHLLEVDPDFHARHWRSEAFTQDPRGHRKIANDLRTAGLA